MAHKVIIDGTMYSVKSGKTLIDGTAYGIKKGRTLIDGTGYNISFVIPVTLTVTAGTYTSGTPTGYSINGGSKTQNTGTFTINQGDTVTVYAYSGTSSTEYVYCTITLNGTSVVSASRAYETISYTITATSNITLYFSETYGAARFEITTA